MSLFLHTIQGSQRGLKKKKRVGRGNSSGSGNYCGKGMKGQKSRSGVSGLKRLGMKKNLKQIPKLRGFKSIKVKNQIINLDVISKNYSENDIVNPQTLYEKNLVSSLKIPIKILGRGELKVKNLKFEKVVFSKKVENSKI